MFKEQSKGWIEKIFHWGKETLKLQLFKTLFQGRQLSHKGVEYLPQNFYFRSISSVLTDLLKISYFNQMFPKIFKLSKIVNFVLYST